MKGVRFQIQGMELPAQDCLGAATVPVVTGNREEMTESRGEMRERHLQQPALSPSYAWWAARTRAQGLDTASQ